MGKEVNTKLLGMNMMVFAGLFTLIWIFYSMVVVGFVSDVEVAVIILGIILIMVGGVLVVNSKNVVKRKGRRSR